MNTRTTWILGLMMTCLLCNLAVARAGDRFTDNGDGTVTDRELSVMWGNTDNQGDIDWKSAERWIKYTFPFSLPQEKREGWRMPTLEELQSLFIRDRNYKGYETDCGQRVKIVPEIQLSCGWVWASEKRSITARVFNFERGYHYTDRMVHKRAYRALPVRSLRSDD
ncbi:MAG: DUF1566 domain-containing protein [Deltaproteobacteria bacterium]|nr:DUF1566 domain-containing protein [Deltaproteobacteria bacterium]